MSGSISSSSASVALSLLQGLTSSSGGSTTDLVSILYGGGQTSTQDPVAALDQAEQNQTQDIALQARDPQTAAEISHFLSVVGKATSLQDIMNDPIAQKVLLTANGLGDQVGYTALATKALLSDPSDPKSLVNQLNNSAYTSTVKTYDFAANGLSVLKQPSVLSTITNGYAQEVWEQSLDTQTPGIAAALDFIARGPTSITQVDNILGDPNFRTVVLGALGIPDQIAFQPLEAQEKAITSRVNISQFKDPTFVQNLAKQYLVMNNLDNSSSSNSSSSSSASSLINLLT